MKHMSRVCNNKSSNRKKLQPYKKNGENNNNKNI